MSTHSENVKAAESRLQQEDANGEESQGGGSVESKVAQGSEVSRDQGSGLDESSTSEGTKALDMKTGTDGKGGGTDDAEAGVGTDDQERDGRRNASSLSEPSRTKPLSAARLLASAVDGASGSSSSVARDQEGREELLLQWREEWEAELAEKRRAAEEDLKREWTARQKELAAREREHYVRLQKFKAEESAAEEQYRRSAAGRVERDLGTLRNGGDASPAPDPLAFFEGGAAINAKPAPSSDSESEDDGLFPRRRATRSYAKTHKLRFEELKSVPRRRSLSTRQSESDRRLLGGQPTLAMTHFSAYSDPSASVEEKDEVLKLVAAEGGTGLSKKKAMADAQRDQQLASMEKEVLRLAAQRDRSMAGQARASADYDRARRQGDLHWQREAKADAIRADERALTLELEVSRQQLEIEKLRMTLSTAREERDNRSRHYPARMKGLVTGFHELTSVNGGGYWATDVLMYLKEVVAKCAVHGYDRPTDTAHMFVSGLSGESLEWYLEFRRAHSDYALNFEVLSLAFLDKFGGGETAMREEFVHIVKQPGETTERLLRRILTLGEALGYSCRAPEVAAQFWAALPKGQQLKCVEHGLGQSRDVYAMLRLLSPIDKYAEEQKRNATRRGGQRSAAATASRHSGAGAGTAVNYVGAGGGGYYAADHLGGDDGLFFHDDAATGDGYEDVYDDVDYQPGGRDFYHTMLEDESMRAQLCFWVGEKMPQVTGQQGRPQQALLLPKHSYCFSCRKPGHYAKDCTDAAAPCYVCGVMGHHKNECPHAWDENRRRKRVSCGYCQCSGHITSGCRRKKDGKPPRELLQGAANMQRFNKAAVAALPRALEQKAIDRGAGGEAAVPTLDDVKQALSDATKNMSPALRTAFRDSLFTQFRQETASRQDFRQRA